MENMAELNRQRVRVMTMQGGGVALILIGTFLFLLNPPLGMLLFAGGMAVMLLSSGARKTYSRNYKNEMVRQALSTLFDDLTLDPDAGFDRQQTEAYQLIPEGNRFYSDDYMEGAVLGIHFRRSDVLVQQVNHSGKHTTTTTLFRGPWMIFDFPKSFGHWMMVREKEFLSNGRPGGLFSRLDVEKVKMESAGFNEIFDVYAQDPHEAFYLLTPHFMEKLVEAETRFDGRFYYGFIDHEFHVAIHNGENSFEAPVWSTVSQQNFLEIREQAMLITELVRLLLQPQQEQV